jgi:hypothetical protein
MSVTCNLIARGLAVRGHSAIDLMRILLENGECEREIWSARLSLALGLGDMTRGTHSMPHGSSSYGCLAQHLYKGPRLPAGNGQINHNTETP